MNTNPLLTRYILVKLINILIVSTLAIHLAFGIVPQYVDYKPSVIILYILNGRTIFSSLIFLENYGICNVSSVHQCHFYIVLINIKYILL